MGAEFMWFLGAVVLITAASLAGFLHFYFTGQQDVLDWMLGRKTYNK